MVDAGYREITADERTVIKALARCTMLPGCSDRRFTERMRAATQISPAAAWGLARIRHRYRRQINEAVPWLRMAP